MDVGQLTPALDAETGFQLGDDRLLELLIEATGTFNAYAVQTVGLMGTTYDRELSMRERRLIVLFALSMWLRGEEVKAAMTAIVHTNVAGRTDLKDVPKRLHELREQSLDEMVKILGEIGNRDVIAGIQAHELGATLRLTGVATGLHQTQTW